MVLAKNIGVFMSKLSVALLLSLTVLSSACSKSDDVSLSQEEVATDTIVEEEVSVSGEDVAEEVISVPVYEKRGGLSAEVEEFDPSAPVSLQNTINMTLKRHRGLKIIRANRETAKYEVRKAKAGYGPSLDLIGDYGYDHRQSGGVLGGAETGMHPGGSVRLVITQPLWDGFSTRSRVNEGIATVDSLTARVFDNATTFTLDAIIAHIDVNRRRLIVDLAETNVAMHLKILGSQRERVELGAAPASDVTQTQGRLLRARASLSQNIELLRLAEAQYYRLTGIYPPVHLEEVAFPDVFYADAESAYRQASLTNPKIRAYLYDIDAAKYSKELVKSGFHPRVDLEVGPSYSDRNTDGRDTDYQKSFDARVQMNWNLFSSFADVNSVRAANSRVVESRQTVMNFMDELKREIDDTYSQYISATEQQAFYAKAKLYNRETRIAYLEQFDIGVRGLSDILDVESEYFSSATEELTAKGNITVGAYRLLALSGELVNALSINEEFFNSMNIEESEKEHFAF